MTAAPVNKIIPSSFVDGPGNRTAIFLQGCNQHCLYCHNPETINMCTGCGSCAAVCPAGALAATEGRVQYNIEKCRLCDACLKVCKNMSSPRIRMMSAVQAMGEIANYLPFITGITVSGGECTLYPDFLCELFQMVLSAGKTAFIDTNGQTELWKNERLLELASSTMIDLKSADDAEHMRLSGMTAALPIENIKRLAPLHKVYEIRTVVVPGLLDNERTVRTGAKLIAPYPDMRYKLIKYRPFGVRAEMPQTDTPGNDLMASLAETAREAGVRDIVVV